MALPKDIDFLLLASDADAKTLHSCGVMSFGTTFCDLTHASDLLESLIGCPSVTY
jgi:hypothetical protein